MLINKTEVRKRLFELVMDNYRWRELVGKDRIRISRATLEEANAALDNWCRAKIAKLPNRGMTI